MEIDLNKVMKKHVIIFSHGFGVKKDDIGLLSEIAESFDDITTLLFDYYDVDETNKTITTTTLSEQAAKLVKVFNDVKSQYPEAVIDIIAHSQGTIIPALVKLKGVRKSIFLAPVFDMSIERTLKRHVSDPNSHINISTLRKLDGYIRFVPKEYWTERATVKPFELYNEYAKNTALFVVNAKEDNILGEVNLLELNSSIKVISLHGDHSFNNEARADLIKVVKEIIYE